MYFISKAAFLKRCIYENISNCVTVDDDNLDWFTILTLESNKGVVKAHCYVL